MMSKNEIRRKALQEVIHDCENQAEEAEAAAAKAKERGLAHMAELHGQVGKAWRDAAAGLIVVRRMNLRANQENLAHAEFPNAQPTDAEKAKAEARVAQMRKDNPTAAIPHDQAEYEARRLAANRRYAEEAAEGRKAAEAQAAARGAE